MTSRMAHGLFIIPVARVRLVNSEGLMPLPLGGEATSESHSMIYHLVLESDFRSQLQGPLYSPIGLSRDGFVHCALERSVIPVANDYFAGVSGRVILLEIDPARLSSETRYEAAAPLTTGGTSHLASASQFPHVYGPINTDAIIGVGVLRSAGAGYEWPRDFVPLDKYLALDH